MGFKNFMSSVGNYIAERIILSLKALCPAGGGVSLRTTKERRWREEVVTLVSSSSTHSINRECKTNTHLPQTTQHTDSHISHHYKKPEEEVDREQADTRFTVRFEHLWFCPSVVPVDKLILILRNYSMFNDIIVVLPHRQRSYLSLEYTNSMENSKLFENKQK